MEEGGGGWCKGELVGERCGGDGIGGASVDEEGHGGALLERQIVVGRATGGGDVLSTPQSFYSVQEENPLALMQPSMFELGMLSTRF